MIQKLLLALWLSVLVLQPVAAAPYNMDAPVESYTWGESVATVWKSRADDDNWHKLSDNTLIHIEKDDVALLFRFWRNQLAGISRSYPSHKMTPEEKSATYARYLDEFTARWGKPALEQPCLASQVTCSEVVWFPSDMTMVTLYQSTAESDRPFVGYAYASRELQPKYEQEIREFGPEYEPYYVTKTFREKPEYAEKTFKGKRIRVEARIASLSPLKLEKKENEILCTPRSSKETKSLRQGQIITVSGVIAGTKEDTLLLSDTILVPDPADAQITVNRKGKRPQGFFTVETFSQQLETASNKVEKDFSIREFISPVRIEGQRAVVDFVGKNTPDGLSFSLEPLYKDQSSDTIAFNMHIDSDDNKVNGYFMLAVVGIIINATQPADSKNDVWGQIKRLINGGAREKKGKVVVNGWTYQVNMQDERNLTFSATAPKHRK